MPEEKTAMQQLKEKLQVVVDGLEKAEYRTDQYGYRSAMENVIKDIDAQMLGIEKQQHIENFTAGMWAYSDDINSKGEDYFNQKFKTK